MARCATLRARVNELQGIQTRCATLRARWNELPGIQILVRSRVVSIQYLLCLSFFSFLHSLSLSSSHFRSLCLSHCLFVSFSVNERQSISCLCLCLYLSLSLSLSLSVSLCLSLSIYLSVSLSIFVCLSLVIIQCFRTSYNSHSIYSISVKHLIT